MKWTTQIPECNKKSNNGKGTESDEPYLCFLKWSKSGYFVRLRVLFPYREPSDEGAEFPDWLSWFDEAGNVYYVKGLAEENELVWKWVKVSDLSDDEKKEFELQ